MRFEVKSEKEEAIEIQCEDSLSVKSYWQAKVMMAVSCSKESQSVKAAFIFKINGIMVMKTHNIDYEKREWSREIAFQG